MPPNFTTAFAERLNSLCEIEVKEAQERGCVLPGRALIAPGNFHMLLRRSGARYYVCVKTGPMVCHQRPAVDVLFRSTAEYAGAKCCRSHPDGHGCDGRRVCFRCGKQGPEQSDRMKRLVSSTACPRKRPSWGLWKKWPRWIVSHRKSSMFSRGLVENPIFGGCGNLRRKDRFHGKRPEKRCRID